MPAVGQTHFFFHGTHRRQPGRQFTASPDHQTPTTRKRLDQTGQCDLRKPYAAQRHELYRPGQATRGLRAHTLPNHPHPRKLKLPNRLRQERSLPFARLHQDDASLRMQGRQYQPGKARTTAEVEKRRTVALGLRPTPIRPSRNRLRVVPPHPHGRRILTHEPNHPVPLLQQLRMPAQPPDRLPRQPITELPAEQLLMFHVKHPARRGSNRNPVSRETCTTQSANRPTLPSPSRGYLSTIGRSGPFVRSTQPFRPLHERSSCSLLRSIALNADHKVRAPRERPSGGDTLYSNLTAPCAAKRRSRSLREPRIPLPDGAASSAPEDADDVQPGRGRRRGSQGAVGKRRPTPSPEPPPNRSAADRSERQPPLYSESASGPWDPLLRLRTGGCAPTTIYKARYKLRMLTRLK